jgi:uroporphyrinogen decarboxylase
MRQAGRYMAEYQEVRRKYSFLEMCRKPEVAAEVTLQPIDRLGVDAAILFSDILVPFEGMGADLEFVPGRGPVIHNPVRTREDAEALKVPDPFEALSYVLEAVKILRERLAGRVPLIGFSGAPFTLASYMVDGGGTRDYLHTKTMMFSEPKTWEVLMEKLTDTVALYLKAQIEAGAQAVQLFDSWAGCLTPSDYREFAMPYTRKIIDRIKGEVPVIHFANQAATFLESVREAGGDVIGVDWRIPLDEAWGRIGHDVGIQGNLDPMVLMAPRDYIAERVKDVLHRAGGRPGHIFNLGHGINKHTPVENVIAMVEAVKRFSHR